MNRSSIKYEARSLIIAAKPKPMLVSTVYVIVLAVVSFLSFQLFGRYIAAFMQSFMQSFDLSDPSKLSEALNKFYASVDPENLMYEFSKALPPVSNRILYGLLIAASLIVGVGFVIFSMNLERGTEPVLGNLFDGFGHLLRLLVLFVLEMLFISLWSMLFFFPAIIAFYRYRLALYLLLERPELSPMQCILESSRLMKGHKTELFLLDLSFIGWFLLVFILNTFGAASGLELFSVVGLGYIAYVPLLPYMHLSWLLFYRKLCPAEKITDADAFLPEL